MVSITSLLDFLMSLLRDEDAAQEFERDPQGVLARNGLDGVCGQDVRDVTPMLADHDGVSHRSHDDDGGGYSTRSYYGKGDDDDPVRAIQYVKNNYEVDNDVVVNNSYNTYNDYDLTYVDDSNTIIDDRDTVVLGDYEDNSTTENTIIEDSFNEDNDGVDNKGGTIDDSIVAGEDVEDSGNEETNVEIEDSFQDNSEDNDTEIDDSVIAGEDVEVETTEEAA